MSFRTPRQEIIIPEVVRSIGLQSAKKRIDQKTRSPLSTAAIEICPVCEHAVQAPIIRGRSHPIRPSSASSQSLAGFTERAAQERSRPQTARPLSASVYSLHGNGSKAGMVVDLSVSGTSQPILHKDFLRRSVVKLSSSQAVPRKPLHPPPPVAGATRPRSAPPATMFRKIFDRGDIPVGILHGASYNKLKWKVPIETLDAKDAEEYALLFFEGLREKEDPYRFVAIQGIFDLLQYHPDKIQNVLPKIVQAIKTALNTRDSGIICPTLQVIKALARADDGQLGLALLPYYRQLLPILNIFINKTANLGDHIQYNQQRHVDIGDEIQETLETLNECGGPDAFVHIKYCIPTWQIS